MMTWTVALLILYLPAHSFAQQMLFVKKDYVSKLTEKADAEAASLVQQPQPLVLLQVVVKHLAAAVKHPKAVPQVVPAYSFRKEI